MSMLDIFIVFDLGFSPAFDFKSQSSLGCWDNIVIQEDFDADGDGGLLASLTVLIGSISSATEFRMKL